MDKTLDEYHEMNRRSDSRKRGRGGYRGGRGRSRGSGRGRGGRGGRDYNDYNYRPSKTIRKPRPKSAQRRLYISNLSRAFQNSDLRKLFEEFGTLKRCGVHFDQMGNSKGTADIEFDTHESAEKAITKLNQAEINGIVMNVDFLDNVKPRKRAKDKDDGYSRGRGRDRERGGRRRRGRPARRNSFEEKPRRRGTRTRRVYSRSDNYESDRAGRATRRRAFKKTLGRRRRN